MRTKGQVYHDGLDIVNDDGLCFALACSDPKLPVSLQIENMAFIVAAWNACDRLNLSTADLEGDAIGKLVEAAIDLSNIQPGERYLVKVEEARMRLRDRLHPFTKPQE